MSNPTDGTNPVKALALLWLLADPVTVSVDVVAEFEDGTFVLLSPDTSPSDERLRQRFGDLWQERGSESGLSVDRYEGKQDTSEASPMEDAA